MKNFILVENQATQVNLLIINQHREDALGGSEIQCDLIGTYMSDFGHDVVYYAVDGDQDRYNTNYDVMAEPLNRKNLSRIISEHEPDIVYWRYNKHKFLRSAFLMKKYGVKTVFGISSVYDTQKWRWYKDINIETPRDLISTLYGVFSTPIKNRVNHFGYYFVSGIVSLNPDLSNRVYVEPQTTIVNSMSTNSESFEWPNKFVFWVANLKSTKKPDIFVKLAKEFENSNIDFLMVGHIQDKKYNYILDDTRLPSNFHYLGPKTPEEVNGILKESLFLVRTDDVEGFGNNFIQAWLQGKPTVTLHEGTGGFIKEKEIGFVSGDFKNFVEDTRTLINNPELRSSMGRRAKSFAKTKFSPEINMRKYEDFFEQVLGK
ncbi:glycosyltransferase family 4 protein [Natrialbaceae archaeon A-CW1-1]